jgi:ATP-binding cassette, subfamily B, multidrug efflux pump
MSSLKRLIPYCLRYRRKFLVGFLFVLLTNVVTVLSPKILGMAVDSLQENFSSDLLLRYAGIIVGIAIAGGIFRFSMRQVLIGLSRHIEYNLRNDFFAHMQELHPAYYDKHKTGDLMSRATNDLNAVRNVLGPGIMYSVNTTFLFTLAITSMCLVHIPLTLLALLPFSALSILVMKYGNRIHKAFERIQAQMSAISAKAQENLSGIRVVKAYVREAEEIKHFDEINSEYVERNRTLIKLWAVFYPMMQLVGGLGVLIILLVGGNLVINNTITLGDFVAFNGYLTMLLWPMIALGWVINVFQRGAASMGRLNAILDEEPAIRDADAPVDVPILNGHITIRDLTFTYPGADAPVLHDISLDIPAGSTLAVVGPTGSGKTTLVNLIPRLYDPPHGTVCIDGHPIQDIPLNTLRGNIGLVPQETFLFSDSIASNIAYGAGEAEEDQVQQAAITAQLHHNIEEFPHQYDTMLGERGINLSGGQKQRLAISRAVILEPPIFIMDDALSSVDTYTEEEILKRLAHVMESRTTIIVSHRISTIQHADHIIVLDEGRIVEQGRHDDLQQQDGLYASIHQKQLLEEELAEAE